MKMKKIFIFAAIAAVLSLTSCQKEGPIETEKNDLSVVSEPPLFTATISPGTKTTVDATKGKVSWEKTDVITVIDSLSNKAVYEVSSIDNITGKATFVFKSGQTLAEKGPYTATYGEAPKTAQTYSETPGNLCMTAPATLTNSFNFTVNCGLLEINLTKEGESVKSVAVSGIPKGGSATTYTLTCSDPQSIGTKKPFYIAVPAGDYYNIVIKDQEGKDCTLTAASGIAVADNHIKPVTFGSEKLVFKHSKLTGVFSVSATKKVQFSRGNLVATIDTNGTPIAWKFAAHQYDRLGTGGANQKIGSAAGDVDLFGWSTKNKFGIDTSTVDIDYSGDFYDWSKAIDENIWRTLSVDEWKYLCEREDNEMYEYPVKVCGIENCLVLAPDDFTPLKDLTKKEYSPEEWAKAEERGLVCLPPTGERKGSVVDLGFIGNGYYWSSTGMSDPATQAGYMGWIGTNDSLTLPTFAYTPRHIGRSVRLVTIANQNP